MKWAPRAEQVMGFLTVDLCRLMVGELCDIIQELEQVLELRLVTVIVIVIVSSSGEARWSLPNIR